MPTGSIPVRWIRPMVGGSVKGSIMAIWVITKSQTGEYWCGGEGWSKDKAKAVRYSAKGSKEVASFLARDEPFGDISARKLTKEER